MIDSESTGLVEVALPLKVQHTFTYEVPSAMHGSAVAGARALVPLGDRRITGFIVGMATSVPGTPLKAIHDLLDPEPLLDSHMLGLTRWAADYYMTSWGLVIRAALPPGIDRSTARIVELIGSPELLLREGDRFGPAQKQILAALQAKRRIPLSSLKRRWPGREVDRLVSSLVSRNLVRLEYDDRLPAVRPAHRAVLALSTDRATVEVQLAGLRARAPRQASLLEHLLNSEATITPVKAAGIAGASAVRGLIAKGLVHRGEEEVERSPWDLSLEQPVATPPPELTPAQRAAVDGLLEGLTSGVFSPALLFGATGSGKTEVYLRVIEEVVRLGKQALVLVPEIALTPLAADRFRARFGGRVALLHSGLSPGERLDQWRRIKSGKADIVVGARSAVFAPLSRLGLIVVDEEHDTSYKQDDEPQYHARDVALARGKMLGIPVLLGSATPAYESFHRAKQGIYRLFTLPERVEARPLPSMTLIDMRKDRAGCEVRGPLILSPPLAEAIEQTLARGEQVLLFLNRRGYARLLLCRECGFAMRCPRCSVSLIYHAVDARMRCHYCDHRERPPVRCPKCRGTAFGLLGYGTQQVEAAVKALVPTAALTRMDRDTTRRRRAHRQILRTVEERQTEVLICTQMVGKGHDFPGITLVGVLSADASMQIPDFRAGERTYALLTQVAGRAGRGDRPGRVLVQTYNPEHYCIVAAQKNDYEGLYRFERALREERGLPPFGFLVMLLVTCPIANRSQELAERLAGLLLERAVPPLAVEGPAPAPLHRLRGRYRWQLLAKGPEPESLHQWVREVIARLPASDRRSIEIGVDPIDLC
jgi:primosomal protein N' (replication factor Y)